jgi:hypothetical protein
VIEDLEKLNLYRENSLLLLFLEPPFGGSKRYLAYLPRFALIWQPGLPSRFQGERTCKGLGLDCFSVL